MATGSGGDAPSPISPDYLLFTTQPANASLFYHYSSFITGHASVRAESQRMVVVTSAASYS